MNSPRNSVIQGPEPLRRRGAAFSLVEVTIAMGLFAFVIVGIIGLFPAALRNRSEAALDTRAAMIAQQIFEGLTASPSLDKALMPDEIEPQRQEEDQGSLAVKDLKSGPKILGYAEQGTTVNNIYDNDSVWANGDNSDTVRQQSIVLMARVAATPLSSLPANRVYLVEVDVSTPPMLPADKRRTRSFSQVVYSP
jgi:type II secretory pathway pseudopilin PulG